MVAWDLARKCRIFSHISSKETPILKSALLLVIMTVGIIPAATPSAVVNITSQHAAMHAFGSGVCLDSPCVHVLTNYHVAAVLSFEHMSWADMKVEGVSVRNAQLFTGPTDVGAQDMETALGAHKYNPGKDLALLTLAAALPAGFSRIELATEIPAIGEDVVRTAWSDGVLDRASGKVVAVTVTHRSANGNLTPLPQHFLLDVPSRSGNSGGAVTDKSGKLLGLVIMRSSNANGEPGTIAISSALISEFLKSVGSSLGNQVLPALEPLSQSATPQQRLPEALPAGLSAIAPPADAPTPWIRALRARSHENADAIQKVIAIENVERWEEGRAKRTSLYEVAISRSGQTYKKLDSAGAPTKEPAKSSLSYPGMKGIVPGEHWSLLPLILDDASIEYLGAGSYAGKAVKVFRYTSSNNGCLLRYMGSDLAADCSGIVIADECLNTLLVTQRMVMPAGDASPNEIRWTEKYNFASIAGHDVLVPAELTMSGQYRTGKTYHAQARWSAYKAFMAETSIHFDEAANN